MNIEQLNISKDVTDSAYFVMKHAKYVTIDEKYLQKIVPLVRERFKKGFDSIDESFGSTGDLKKDINIIYFETAANFCFWSQNEKTKWKVKHNNSVHGGWYGLRNAFARALDLKMPLYDATFMSELTIQKAEEIFRGENGTHIPLLEQRVNNIVEAAQYLNNYFGGSGYNLVKSCDYNAPLIAGELARSLNSYRDGVFYKGRWIWILKRAQIFPNDISQLTQEYPEFIINNKNGLTIFADYKLPQLLRYLKVLSYANELAEDVDNKRLIPSGSQYEIEIRSATIVACEKLGKLCPDIPMPDIDVSLWLLSKEEAFDRKLAPHHMTISSYY